MLTILLTAVVTLVVVLAIANLSTGEKKIEHKIERRYGSDDPQFIRSMGLLLGPPVTSGNRFDVLVNGDEIFPSMLEGIASAQKPSASKRSSTGPARSASRSPARCRRRRARALRCMCCSTGLDRRRWTGTICICSKMQALK